MQRVVGFNSGDRGRNGWRPRGRRRRWILPLMLAVTGLVVTILALGLGRLRS